MNKNYILIISSQYDVTTNIVVSWLNKFDSKYIRFNTETQSTLNSLSIKNSGVSLYINNFDLSFVKILWHRRGRLRHIPNMITNKNNKQLNFYLKKEEDSLIKSIELYFKSKIKYIGSYIKEVENYKMYHLIEAQKCQLKIPNSIITTSKKELLTFYQRFNKIITKDIRYPFNLKTNKHNLSSKGTFVINLDMFDNLNDNFAPVFAQELIDKVFEIRVFIFEETLYSMAIFSQNNPKTKIDFRNYDDELPNRAVPFLLPNEISKNIIQFTKKIGLNTGSIDLIYSTKNEFIFLEINPMGQFDWVSKNCNYYIEKEIAIKLSSYEN